MPSKHLLLIQREKNCLYYKKGDFALLDRTVQKNTVDMGYKLNVKLNKGITQKVLSSHVYTVNIYIIVYHIYFILYII